LIFFESTINSQVITHFFTLSAQLLEIVIIDGGRRVRKLTVFIFGVVILSTVIVGGCAINRYMIEKYKADRFEQNVEIQEDLLIN
jgi:hypothetical protein